jgi:hypothetical protein
MRFVRSVAMASSPLKLFAPPDRSRPRQSTAPRQSPTAFAGPLALRATLIVCCAAAVFAAVALAHPDAGLAADAELAFLLRGMAVLKATMVLAAITLLVWRFGLPVARRTAVVYVLGVAALTGASVLIWRLSSIPMAALVFHVAGFAVLLAAWRDGAVSRLLPIAARSAAVDPPAARAATAPSPLQEEAEARALEPA